jgi:hypothetical protein
VIRGFWSWLVWPDRDGDRGISNVVNRWLIFHLSLAALISLTGNANGNEIAAKIALPGSAVLIGLAFGWAGRSAGLFTDKAFSKFIIENGAPIEGYVYSFQLAILAVLLFVATSLTISYGGIGVTTYNDNADERINKFIVTALGSIASRECWGVIMFVNRLTIQFYKVREDEIANS